MKLLCVHARAGKSLIRDGESTKIGKRSHSNAINKRQLDLLTENEIIKTGSLTKPPHLLLHIIYMYDRYTHTFCINPNK